MAGDYQYNEEEMRLKINCLGYIYGANVEDYPECMARVIDTVLEVKKVVSITLAKEREYEYDYEQTKMITEIAGVIELIIKENLAAKAGMIFRSYDWAYPDWNARMQYIFFELMRRDPVGAYVEILREIRFIKVRMRSSTSKDAFSALHKYGVEILAPIKDKLEATKLITLAKSKIAGYHIGDRTIYRQIFSPMVRPNFMLTRFMIVPPEGGRSMDRYMVGDSQVEIYKMPSTAEYFYHLLPPEFRLPDDKYAVLDQARMYMATHQPKTVEFVKSKHIRDVFFNIGKDMIRDVAEKSNVHLKSAELDQLASILTRYTAGLGVLEILMNDQRVQDIYVNSPIERQPILVFHGDFEECRTNLIPTHEDAEAWATRLRIESGRPLDEANPVLDAEINVPGGSARFAVITRTLSPEGLGFAIRRHRDRPWTLPLFIKSGMIDPLAAGLLSFLVDGSVSLLVAGGRGAGKTSMLAALMLELLPKVRIVTIEDTLELPVKQMRELNFNIEQLKSRSVITRVETEMPADEALRTALRLGDSALIVGEVRSVEARALYEAMRIGALSNVVAGTIHGESAYGVYDRVVNDLGVPPTSFKATDIVPICKTLRSADGMHRFRRMTEITEVRKSWENNPLKEGGFVNLMEYSGKLDRMKPTDTLLNGESDVLNRIASYVKEWSGDWSAVWDNIQLRAKIKQTMVEMSDKLKRPEMLEAEWVMLSNSKYHLIVEQLRKDQGAAEAGQVYEQWAQWMKSVVK
jgi:type IV secretory pathway ATPase VirB11/archaellum biosynthesis ATPase